MADKQKTRKPKARANGEGTMFQRSSDKLWVGRLPIGYKPDGSIKYRQFTGKRQSDVKEKMDKIKSEIRTNTYVEPNKITLKEWLDTWLNVTIKESVKNTTWLSYKGIIENHVIPEIGGIKLLQLQTANLQKLYNDKLKSGRLDKRKIDGTMKLKDGGLSPKTIRYMHTIIRSALEQAVNEKVVQVNVAEYAKLPKNPKKEMKTLATGDIASFLNAAKGTRYFPAFKLELYTGLRRGELLGLRWKDIDFKNDRIKVVQQLVYEGGKHVIRELKTECSQNRIIVLPKEMMQELKDHKKRQAEERKALGLSELYDGLVFTSETGNFVQTRNFDRCFKAILKKAKLPDMRIHDLRHTFALISLQAGADIKTLQNDLGHESIQTTLDKYGHVNAEMKKHASDKRSQLLNSIITKNQQVQ